MKRLTLVLLGCLTGTSALFAVHCGSADPHPPPGTTDVSGDSGVTKGTVTDDGGSAIEISPTDVQLGDKGLVNCGTQAAAQTITFTNRTAKSHTFKATLSTGADYYTLSPDTVSVAANSTGTMQIVPKALPAKSDVAPELYSANVDVTDQEVGGSAPSGATTIRVHQTARGVILKSTATATGLAYGGVKIGTSSGQTISLTNSGNVSADLTFTLGSSAFSVDAALKTFSLAPNGTKVQTVTFAPTLPQAYNDTLVMSVAAGTPLCDALPANATLSGTGTNAVGVLPGNLAFGLVNCSTTAAPKTVVISNSGAAMTAQANLALGAGSFYTLADDSTGTAIALNGSIPVAAGGSFTLRIVPKQVTAPITTTTDGLADKLTITTDSPGDAPHVVQLTETAQGAFIVLNQASYKVTDAAAGHSTFTNFNVTNSGNLPGSYTLAVAGRAGVPAGTFGLNSAGGAIGVGVMQTPVLQTTTDATWQCTTAPKSQWLGDITLVPSATAVCSPPQPTAPVSLECP